MNRFSATLGAFAVALGLTACNGTEPTDIATLLSSTQGQSFLTALGAGGNLIPGIESVLANINTAISTNGAAALQTVCFALPWADGALDLFGPAANINSTVISETDAAVKAFVAGPCATPPTTLATAIQDGAQLFLNIENELKTNGVPVDVPASTSLTAGRLR